MKSKAQPPPPPFFLFYPLFYPPMFFFSFPPRLTANSNNHEDQKRPAPPVINSGRNCQQQATRRQQNAALTPAKAAPASVQANSGVVFKGFKWVKRRIHQDLKLKKIQFSYSSPLLQDASPLSLSPPFFPAKTTIAGELSLSLLLQLPLSLSPSSPPSLRSVPPPLSLSSSFFYVAPPPLLLFSTPAAPSNTGRQQQLAKSQAQPPPHPFFLFSPLFSFTFFFSSFPPHLTASSSHEDKKRAAPPVSNSGGNCQQQPMKQQATSRQPKAALTPAKAARSSGKANSGVVSEGFKWAKRWIFNRSVPGLENNEEKKEWEKSQGLTKNAKNLRVESVGVIPIKVSYCFIFNHVINELSSAKETRISIIQHIIDPTEHSKLVIQILRILNKSLLRSLHLLASF
ncbi:uncharacterized protein LOC107030003 [Solanum pennellii]|uniref:Uncharacterized protein LOC107030003 n=1 Tax=Solanum pennellii TaxID=28526 RepID=A0ABM1UW69_SOLPN|nr:uncharacterized protein LOC107030003 [Solanum pennellii]